MPDMTPADREHILEPVWVRYGDWSGRRATAVEALLIDKQGRYARLLWTTDMDGRTAEWRPYRVGAVPRPRV
jgi:hypothetical protein